MILVRDIQRAVAEHYGLPLETMSDPDLYGMRQHKFAHPRQDAMLLAHRMTSRNKSHLGRLFGGRDHTTILSGIRAARRRCLTNRASLEALCAIRVKLLTDNLEPPCLMLPL